MKFPIFAIALIVVLAIIGGVAFTKNNTPATNSLAQPAEATTTEAEATSTKQGSDTTTSIPTPTP